MITSTSRIFKSRRLSLRLLLTLNLLALLALGCGEMQSDSEYYGADGSSTTYSDATSSYPSDSYTSYDTSMSSDAANGQPDTGTLSDVVDDTAPVEPTEPIATNPFTMAAFDPLSTFAADVDTASYQLFKQYVQYGSLPNAASVRLEEWVNYFTYDYEAPAADSAVPFAIHLEASASPFASETTLLSVGIKGKTIPPEEKKAANLVFLIDVSGSMSSADKLPLVKKVLTETVTILDPGDKIAIVTYASGVSLRLAPTAVRDSQTIINAINGLSAGGSTNGEGGIQLAYQQAESAFIEGGINHVILCTDGDFNVGTSSTDGLVALIEQKRTTGITLTVLGFGYGLNDSMMEAVSNAGNGVYGVIGSLDDAIDYVHHRMLSTLLFIAKDMKIQVEFNPEKVLAYRLLGYENRAIADVDFTNDRVDAGEVGASHTVTALYELVLAGSTVPVVEGAPAIEDGPAFDATLEVAPEDLVMVKVRYKDVDATELDPAYQVDVSLAQVGTSIRQTSSNLQWAAAIAAFAEILKGSPYADPTKLDTIRELAVDNAGADADRLEFVTLFDLARVLIGQ